jgi:transposase-like protein
MKKERKKRVPSFKGQVRATYNSSGADAAVKLGYEVGTKQSRLLRWLKQWSNGKVTEIEPAPVRVSERAQRVEVFPGRRVPSDQRWLGAVVHEGVSQSSVRLIQCPQDTLRGTIQIYPNDWFKPVVETGKLRGREKRTRTS